MRLEREVIEPVFVPVVVTLETQEEEVDLFYGMVAGLNSGIEKMYGVHDDFAWNSYNAIKSFASKKPLPYIVTDVRDGDYFKHHI